MGSRGMNDRITVHIAEDTTPAELQAVAREVAVKFDLSLPEAEALLKADVIVLERGEAEALVAICQTLGIRGKMTKPKPPVSRTARLGRRALPWLLALLGGVVLVTLLSLVLPEVSVLSGGNPTEAPTAATTEVAEPTVPVIATTDKNTDAAPAALDSAVPRIVSATTPDGGEDALSASGVPTIASAPLPEDASVDPATEEPPDLFTAARDLSVTDVERALETTADLDARDAYGQTALMYAAGANAAPVVNVLLAAAADVNATSDAGWTPLMYAARNTDDPEVVKTLLAAGADPAALNENAQGARDIALAYNNSAAASIPAPARPVPARPVETSPAPDRQDSQALPASLTPPGRLVTVPPTPGSPASPAGGRPITITPRPLPVPSFPSPVAVQRAPAETASSPVPIQVDASPAPLHSPASPVQPASQERDIILDCLQNWDACGN